MMNDCELTYEYVRKVRGGREMRAVQSELLCKEGEEFDQAFKVELLRVLWEIEHDLVGLMNVIADK